MLSVSNNKPRLVYDANCPVCTNYVKLLKKKISEQKLDYLPSTAKLEDIQYVNAKNQMFSGNNAIQQLANDFPAVLDYVWMLPSSYKVQGLKAAYKIGGTVRRLYNRVTRHKCCGR